MSKKLPGLKRRAPQAESSDTAERVSVETPDPAASEPPKAKKRSRRKRPEPIKNVSAERDGKKIEAEIIPKASPAGASIQFDRAVAIVDKRAKWAAAGGVLPIPLIDIAAIAAVQLTMLRELSEIYDVPFSKNRGRAIISALVGSIFPWAAGVGLAGLIVKATPVLGWGVGLATISVLAGASTRAMGLVFTQHYESGGTLFDFDPDAMRDHYRREYEQAKAA